MTAPDFGGVGLAPPMRAARDGAHHSVPEPRTEEYVGGPCPDPLRCLHYMRFATGPWTCEHNHPREIR